MELKKKKKLMCADDMCDWGLAKKKKKSLAN